MSEGQRISQDCYTIFNREKIGISLKGGKQNGRF